MSRVGLGLINAALALLLAGCSGLTTGTVLGPQSVQEPREATATAAPTPVPVTAAPTQAPLQLDDLLGDDGRLSVLILGTDHRKGIIGERTDAIIVASIDPVSGKVAMASMPRDTVNVPIAPGRVHATRINTLYWDFQRKTRTKKAALKKTKKAFEYAFDTEIDYYALVDFAGLVRLVNSIGGIEVSLDAPLIDPTMHIGKRGLRLKAGQRHLDGKTTLAFSRTRHSDSDYERARRQQQVIAAAAVRVRDRGLDALPALVDLVGKKVITNLPLRAAPVLFELVQKAGLKSPKSIVLAPSRWARPAAEQYTIAPRVIEVRKMFDRVFRPIK